MNMWCGKKRGVHRAAFVIAASLVAFTGSSVKAALLGLTANNSFDFTVTPAVDTLGLPTGPQVFYSGMVPLNDIGGNPLTGYVQSWVYDDTASSTTLDFVYQLTNTGAAGVDSFKELTLSPFGTFTTNVGYEQTAAVDPSGVDRNGNNVIDWYFAGASGVAPGTSSDLLVVQTNAMNYHMGSAEVIDGGTANATVNVPFAGNVVPEPASVSLIVIASGMLLGRRRRA